MGHEALVYSGRVCDKFRGGGIRLHELRDQRSGAAVQKMSPREVYVSIAIGCFNAFAYLRVVRPCHNMPLLVRVECMEEGCESQDRCRGYVVLNREIDRFCVGCVCERWYSSRCVKFAPAELYPTACHEHALVRKAVQPVYREVSLMRVH